MSDDIFIKLYEVETNLGKTTVYIQIYIKILLMSTNKCLRLKLSYEKSNKF